MRAGSRILCWVLALAMVWWTPAWCWCAGGEGGEGGGEGGEAKIWIVVSAVAADPGVSCCAPPPREGRTSSGEQDSACSDRFGAGDGAGCEDGEGCQCTSVGADGRVVLLADLQAVPTTPGGWHDAMAFVLSPVFQSLNDGRVSPADPFGVEAGSTPALTLRAQRVLLLV